MNKKEVDLVKKHKTIIEHLIIKINDIQICITMPTIDALNKRKNASAEASKIVVVWTVVQCSKPSCRKRGVKARYYACCRGMEFYCSQVHRTQHWMITRLHAKI